MDSNFKAYSKYYNLLYKDKDYSKEVDYISSCIKNYKPEAKSILEFGSGTGGHGLLLKKHGFSVFGIERSSGMVDEAQKLGFDCMVGDIIDFNLNKTFDAIISMFHVISYLTENDSLIKTFKNAFEHLSIGGLFLFDVWYSPAVYDQKALPRIKRMEDMQLSVTRVADPIINENKNLVDVQFSVLVKDKITKEVTELFESHPMRHFSIPEIQLLAEMTGFIVEKVEEFVSGKNPSKETWGVCFVLRKKD